jgi:hypothetical protein
LLLLLLLVVQQLLLVLLSELLLYCLQLQLLEVLVAVGAKTTTASTCMFAQQQ